MSHSQQQQSSYMKQPKSAQEMHQHHQHYGGQDPYAKTQKRSLGSGSYLPAQRSFSSSEEDIRSTPEFEGELEKFPCLFFCKKKTNTLLKKNFKFIMKIFNLPK